jgi:glycine/D-amino acid oxidase-like deaminating enzyme/nitrite reductase/ring-hydroxylating ferredoxin subunit
MEKRTNPSLWIETSAPTDYPALEGEVSVDVAIVGGGITGITAARLLKDAGKSVALVEAERIVQGVTGYTTAKLTVGHGLIYANLEKSFGHEGARLYADSNGAAITRIAELVEADRIDCDFERAANYVYSESSIEAPQIRAEVEAAKRAGVEADFTTDTDLPFPVAAAIRVPDQAQFHPRKYLLPLAASLPAGGSHVFERSRVKAVSSDGGDLRVETGHGVVRATDVVLATHLPFLDRGFFFARAHPAMSYAVSAEVDEGDAPRGMYISASQPTRSVRSAPLTDDRRTLIVGGEGHRPGLEDDTERRYDALEAFLRERFQARPEHRWSAHDYQPVDGLPYIGKLTRRGEHIYVATGFAKWGLTKGTLAAMLITDLIVGRKNPWAKLYDAKRLTPTASRRAFLRENGQVALHFVAGRIRHREGREAIDELGPGEGRIVRVGVTQTAAYRDEDGTLHTLSPACTHLGCVVEWNRAERTWDCPCHGSRFSATGDVIEGPAVKPLSGSRPLND